MSPTSASTITTTRGVHNKNGTATPTVINFFEELKRLVPN